MEKRRRLILHLKWSHVYVCTLSVQHIQLLKKNSLQCIAQQATNIHLNTACLPHMLALSNLFFLSTVQNCWDAIPWIQSERKLLEMYFQGDDSIKMYKSKEFWFGIHAFTYMILYLRPLESNKSFCLRS
jgi:hypothetical protein